MCGSSSEELIFFEVYGIFQHWSEKRSFSYLDMPRPNHDLIYILCERAIFENGIGERKEFKNGDIIYLPKGKKYKATFFRKQQ